MAIGLSCQMVNSHPPLIGFDFSHGEILDVKYHYPNIYGSKFFKLVVSFLKCTANIWF